MLVILRNSSLSANTSKSSIKESFLSLLETVNEDFTKILCWTSPQVHPAESTKYTAYSPGELYRLSWAMAAFFSFSLSFFYQFTYCMLGLIISTFLFPGSTNNHSTGKLTIFLSLFSSKPTHGSLLYLDSTAYRPLAICEL